MTKKLVLIDDLTSVQMASICDHSFLGTYSVFMDKEGDPRKLREQNFRTFLDATIQSERIPYSVVVLSDLVPMLVEYLDEHGRKDIKVASAACFPYGSVHTDFKVCETKVAIALGAVEIDVVFNFERFLAGDVDGARDDAKAVADVTHEKGALLKLIIETSKLNPDQIKEVCHLADEAGADFVKTTSGGFGGHGATVDDLKIMREHFSRGVKMSGPMEPSNIKNLFRAASGRTDGYIDFDPMMVRIGEGTLRQYIKPGPGEAQQGEGTLIDRL
jgi:deoxyribose-phosphate aldolase